MPPPGAYTPCRLLVVTGPPGVGKTTLVTRVAKEFAANVPHVQVAGFWTEEVRQDEQIAACEQRLQRMRAAASHGSGGGGGAQAVGAVVERRRVHQRDRPRRLAVEREPEF